MNVIVIGSGVAGLAAANRLRALGIDVMVFEANDYAGGKLTEFRRDGYRFDAGPSLFTMPHFLDDVFKASGKNPREYYSYQKLDTTCHYFYEDSTRITAYGDPEKFSAEVATQLNVDPARIKHYLNRSKDLYEKTGKVFIEKSLHSWKTWLSWDVVRALPSIPRMGLFSTLNQFNKKHFMDQRLVQLFNRYATYNGSNPYQAPGILSTIPHLEFNIGTFLPEGGMHTITRSLVKLAEDQGVEFRYNTKVDEIVVEGDTVKGVLADGFFYPAGTVVSTMDVFYTYRKLLRNQPAPESTLRQERSSSALIFYWGIGKLFPELDLHNIFFTSDYRQEFKVLFEDKTVYNDPTVYVNITSKFVPGDAPEGCENWFVMINVPSDTGQDWETLIQQARVNILAKLSRILKIDIESSIQTEEILDPRKLQYRTHSYQGSLYGTSSNNRMAAFLRHRNQSSQFQNLFFSGGSVHPGGGIPLCLNSAKITTALIAEQFAVPTV
jgi:phytoene desaturase